MNEKTKRTIYEGRVIDLVEENATLPNGKTTTHATVIHRGAVVILPKTSRGALLLLRQYRHSLGQEILEFPAGSLEKGEEPFECAKRELPEEVGYAARDWRPLGLLYPAPGFCTEVQHCFFATDLYPERSAMDEDEIIEVEEHSVEQVEKLIVDGNLRDGKSLAIFLRARLQGLL